MTLDVDEEQPFLGYELSQSRGYSETSAAKVDQEVQLLLKERYDYTRQCLIEKRAALDMLVAALIEHETITQEEMETIVGSRPC